MSVSAQKLGDLQDRVLSREQEAALIRQVRAGREAQGRLSAGHLSVRERTRLAETAQKGREAEAEFMQANLRLAIKCARQTRRWWEGVMDEDDAIQEALAGAIIAMLRFDPERGFKYSTYAMWWMRQAIERGVQKAESGPVLSSRSYSRRLALEGVITEAAKCGQALTAQQAATAVGIDATEAVWLMAYQRPVSLSATIEDGAEGPLELADALGEADPTLNGLSDWVGNQQLLQRLLRVLDARSAAMIRLHYGLGGAAPLSITAASAELGISATTGRRLVHLAMLQLRREARQLAEMGTLEEPVSAEDWPEAARWLQPRRRRRGPDRVSNRNLAAAPPDHEAAEAPAEALPV